MAVLVVCLALVSPTASVASPEHLGVVRENPAKFTPRLRSDNAVERPHVDAYSRSRGTVYAGGTFRTVSNAAYTRTYRRHHVMALDDNRGRLARWYYRAFRKPYSPRGGYFVVVSTGQISRSGDLGETVCDAAARFETDVRRPQPTHVDQLHRR